MIRSDTEENGMRFHAKETITSMGVAWQYEATSIPLKPTKMLLVRIIISRIRNMDRLINIFQSTPIRAGQPGHENWNCVEWVKEALELAGCDGEALQSPTIDWELVRNTAMWYANKKQKEHRFDGQGTYDQSKTATWDLLTRQELIP